MKKFTVIEYDQIKLQRELEDEAGHETGAKDGEDSEHARGAKKIAGAPRVEEEVGRDELEQVSGSSSPADTADIMEDKNTRSPLYTGGKNTISSIMRQVLCVCFYRWCSCVIDSCGLVLSVRQERDYTFSIPSGESLKILHFADSECGGFGCGGAGGGATRGGVHARAGEGR